MQKAGFLITRLIYCRFKVFISRLGFKERDLAFDCSSSCSLLFYYFYRLPNGHYVNANLHCCQGRRHDVTNSRRCTYVNFILLYPRYTKYLSGHTFFCLFSNNVCLSVCLSVCKLCFRQRFLLNYLTWDFELC